MLETLDIRARMDSLNRILIKELEVLELGSKIQSQVQSEVGKNQREYFLREQMKAIQKELGEGDDQTKEIEELQEKIEAAGMPEPVKKEAVRELDRLSKMPVAAAEYTVSRTYLDWLVALPWNKRTDEVIDLPKTKATLDADHSGLEKAKDRILEYLAVRKLNPDGQGADPLLRRPSRRRQDVARAIDRRVARPQVRARVARRHARRGGDPRPPPHLHRRAARARSSRGCAAPSRRTRSSSSTRSTSSAPTSAAIPRRRCSRCSIPEQNNTFRDHYLDVPFDLSEVLFITTANVLDPVPPALRDRMEVLEIAGYTEEEKLKIADRSSRRQAGEEPRADARLHPLHARRAAPGDPRLHARGRRPQPRTRDRRALPQGGAPPRRRATRRAIEITPDVVVEMLGAPKFLDEEMEERTKDPGVAIGLAWTPAGGEVLFIEASKMAGTGSLTLTGQLGDVMKESARAALSWLRTHAREYNIDPDFFTKAEMHVHVPSGAIPKDGPSAGVTMATAMASQLTGRPVRGDLAMTGEITLSGRVLPIGGVKEKVLAARRVGINEVILPKQNAKNVNEDLTPELRQGLTVHLVSTIDEVLALALQPVASDVRPANKPARIAAQLSPRP